jgi:hypothetical protein
MQRAPIKLGTNQWSFKAVSPNVSQTSCFTNFSFYTLVMPSSTPKNHGLSSLQLTLLPPHEIFLVDGRKKSSH